MEQFAQFAKTHAVEMTATHIPNRTQSFDFPDDTPRRETPAPVHFQATLTIAPDGVGTRRTLWSGEYSIGIGIAESWARKNVSKVHTFQGFNMRDALRNPLPYGRSYRVDSEYWTKIRDAYGKARPFPVSDVLLSLQMDVMGADESFPDWAANYGYSGDSITAKRIWETVNDTRRTMRDAMGAAIFESFGELEE